MVSLLSQVSICWRIRWEPLDNAVGTQDLGLPIPFPPGNNFQAHGEEKPNEEWAVWTSNRDTELSWPDSLHSEVAGWVEEEGSGCCSPPQQGFDTAGHNIPIHKMTRQAARWKENCLNCRGWWHKVQLECVVSNPFLSDLGTGQVHPQQLC